MMGNRRSCKASLSPAQLAEEMPFKECFPGLPPRGSVALVGARISLVAFVGARSLFRMLLAVPTVGEMWTAWVAARSLGLVGHEGYSLGQKESPGGIPELSIGLV